MDAERKKPVPKWRDQFEEPQALYGSRTIKVKLPNYLVRWLIGQGNGNNLEDNIPKLLERSALAYFDAFARPPDYRGSRSTSYLDSLICGRYVDGNERLLCQQFLEEYPRPNVHNDRIVVCVSNGRYGFFFMLHRGSFPEGAEREGPFVNWVDYMWPLNKSGKPKIDGPVVRLRKGDWPLHPRLTPGHPESGDKLEY